jgi:hypothetical protein
VTAFPTDELTALLAKHQDYVTDDDSSGIVCAGCFVRLDPEGDSHTGSLAGLTAHQAAVVKAWIDAQTREEWIVRRPSDGKVLPMDDEREARLNVELYAQIGGVSEAMRRRVTEWEARK